MSVLQSKAGLVIVCACLLPLTHSIAAERVERGGRDDRNDRNDRNDYPTKPIRMIVPFVAGGGTDLLARFVAPRFGDLLGQQVVVDNRGGAGSMVGTQIVAKATPDGYTLGLFDTAFAINPAVLAKLPYDSTRDFIVIAIIATNPSLLVAHPGLKVKTVQGLVELAKTNPGRVKFASAGTGAASHLSGELLAAAAKIKMVHVPFKGAGAAIIDVLGGHTDITFVVPGTVRQHLQSGTLVGLAVTGSRPAPTLPDVPTFASAGLPSVDTSSFRFVAAPARLPAPIQTKLTTSLRTAMDVQELQTRLVDNGYDPVFITLPEARAFIETEMRKWRQAVKDAGVKPN